MSSSNMRLLFARRKAAQAKLDEYERKAMIYLTKMRNARKKLRYYDAKIEKAVQATQPTTPKRVIEV